MKMCISCGSVVWMNPNVFITRGSETSDVRVCSEADESKRWGKERSQLINTLGAMVGGQAWIMPAFVISDCLWSLLSHHTLQLDYHPIPPQKNWMNFTKPQIGEDIGIQICPHSAGGGEGEMEKYTATVAAVFFSSRSPLLSYSTCALSFTLEISLSACVCVLTPCQCRVIYSVLSEGSRWHPVCPHSSSIMTKFIIPLSAKWHCWQGEVTYFTVSMSNGI